MPSISLATALCLAGQPLPDELDILRGADTTPHIQLLLDTSGSMGWSPSPSVCDYYPTAQKKLRGSFFFDGTWYLSRTDQLKAALTGCKSADDGILDHWSSRVMFSVREFGGNRTNLLAPFDTTLNNLAALEKAVLGLKTGGTTPLALVYRWAAVYYQTFFSNSNTEQCRQNYIVLMTDGVGNRKWPEWFDFVPGQPPLLVHDARECFGNPKGNCPPPPYPDAAAEYLLEDEAGNPVDVLPFLDGVQPIRTYTIGFEAPEAADALLRAMAARGDGQAFSATSYEQLSEAFSSIISTIVARSRVTFSGGSIEGDGLFSGNYIYLSVFRPRESGVWAGSTKKFCVLPEPGQTDCMFIRNGSHNELLINPNPVDQWTGLDSQAADSGGSGQAMLTHLFGVKDPKTATPPPNPLDRRTILTWRSGEKAYVPVHPKTLDEVDTWTTDVCEKHALLNSLHGFTREVTDCTKQDMSPVSFSSWPQGDTVHGGTLLLQYTDSCDNEESKCFAVTASNDGMLHFFDARTGVETAAVIPAELWGPNHIAHHKLVDRYDQPSLETSRRYFLDAKLRLFHDDRNGNLVIDPEEQAQVIFGLGRGGRGYYLMDVNRFDGVPNAENNPPRPLFPDASALRHLEDTWASPATAFLPDPEGGDMPVAVFPSGHIAELDAPDASYATLPNRTTEPSFDTWSTPFKTSCEAIGIPVDLCMTPDFSTHCSDIGESCAAEDACSACPYGDPKTCAAFGHSAPYCYDWPGWAVLAPAGGVWSQSPTEATVGPLSYQDGSGATGQAYRLNFDYFDLQPGDYISILDEEETEVVRLEGTLTSTTISSPWILSDVITLRVITDGLNDRPARGYRISSVDVIRNVVTTTVAQAHRPSIFVVDLHRWNQSEIEHPPFDGSELGSFKTVHKGDAGMGGGLQLRFTGDCSDVEEGLHETCIDQHTSELTSDLRWMVCPISAEPTLVTEGGIISSIYFGDECGQLWRVRRETGGLWTAARILRLNSEETKTGSTIAGFDSKDYRKVFSKVDVVVSTCPGHRALGVYFGTGNIQRPSAKDGLQNPTVTRPNNAFYSDERNVVGVVWDSSLLPANASLSDLYNVTNVSQVKDPRSPANANGWYIELDPHERMLRAPLVFDGFAYFDLYNPETTATECLSALGRNRTLVMDNCTALGYGDVVDPLTPNQESTKAVRENSTPSTGFSFIASNTTPAFVSLGLEGPSHGSLNPITNRSRAQIVKWWRLEEEP